MVLGQRLFGPSAPSWYGDLGGLGSELGRPGGQGVVWAVQLGSKLKGLLGLFWV